MPLLPWGGVGGDTTLPYCEFLSLFLGVMWVDAAGVDKSLSGFIVADTALHRAWTELRKGFTDLMWTPTPLACRCGGFGVGGWRAAAVAGWGPPSGPPAYACSWSCCQPGYQAWLRAMTLTRGMLGDAVSGRLAVAGSICYYAEVIVGPRSLDEVDGAFAVHVNGLAGCCHSGRQACVPPPWPMLYAKWCASPLGSSRWSTRCGLVPPGSWMPATGPSMRLLMDKGSRQRLWCPPTPCSLTSYSRLG